MVISETDAYLYFNMTIRTLNADLMTDHKTISKELEVTILKLHAVAKAELTEKGTLGDKPAVSQTVSATPTSITREAPSRPQTKEPISSSSLDIRAAGATSEPESSQDVSSTQAQEGKTSQATSELGAIQSDQAAAPVVVVKSPVFTVRMVLPDSPAAAAGLMERDEIVAFGDITCSSVQTALREANASRSGDEPTTFAKIAMQMVSNLVRSHVNRPIALQVLRPEENLANAPAFVTPQHNDDGTLTLSLTPQTWSGRGLLGCEVVPIAPQ